MRKTPSLAALILEVFIENWHKKMSLKNIAERYRKLLQDHVDKEKPEEHIIIPEPPKDLETASKLICHNSDNIFKTLQPQALLDCLTVSCNLSIMSIQ